MRACARVRVRGRASERVGLFRVRFFFFFSHHIFFWGRRTMRRCVTAMMPSEAATAAAASDGLCISLSLTGAAVVGLFCPALQWLCLSCLRIFGNILQRLSFIPLFCLQIAALALRSAIPLAD